MTFFKNPFKKIVNPWLGTVVVMCRLSFSSIYRGWCCRSIVSRRHHVLEMTLLKKKYKTFLSSPFLSLIIIIHCVQSKKKKKRVSWWALRSVQGCRYCHPTSHLISYGAHNSRRKKTFLGWAAVTDAIGFSIENRKSGGYHCTIQSTRVLARSKEFHYTETSQHGH